MVSSFDFGPQHTPLLHLRHRTQDQNPQPLPTQKGSLHQCFRPRSNFTSQTHRIIICLLGITSRENIKIGHMTGYVQILPNERIHYLSICGTCDMKISTETPNQYQFLPFIGTGHQWMKQDDKKYSACPLRPIGYLTIFSYQIIQ